MSANANIAALVLAGGSSSRFGGDKRLAQPSPNELPLLQQSVSLPLSLQLPTLVVLRADDQHQQQALLGVLIDNPLLHWEFSEHAAQGMGSSLADGMRRLQQQGDYDGVFILLADMPWIQADTLVKLASHCQPDKIIIPSYQQTNQPTMLGHPVLFSRRWFKQLQQLQGDQGAKKILRANPASVVEVKVKDKGVNLDIDRPEDFAANP